jgi:hypothetical protein
MRPIGTEHLLCFGLGVVEKFRRFRIWSDTECKTPAENGLQQDSTPSIPSQPHTVRTYILYFDKREKGSSNQREGKRGNSGEYRSQNWVLNTKMTECTQEIGYLQSIHCDKHLPQSPIAIKFF